MELNFLNNLFKNYHIIKYVLSTNNFNTMSINVSGSTGVVNFDFLQTRNLLKIQ